MFAAVLGSLARSRIASLLSVLSLALVEDISLVRCLLETLSFRDELRVFCLNLEGCRGRGLGAQNELLQFGGSARGPENDSIIIARYTCTSAKEVRGKHNMAGRYWPQIAM